ncbi:Uma2 family endonuclease [Phreatobacter sp.]|uniref:Uma2 family endonuclease n=1 Tax=Phreatobacter sp. TaxID=1966341 RepID=UPI0025FE14FC|nr:Uma2 family endonuclease [Phreatobacter sp.]
MNVMVTQGAEGLPRRAFTVEDAFRMLETGILQDNERVELIEGEFVPMNAKNRIHQRLQDDLIMALARLLPRGFRVGTEPTLQLSETTFLAPDLVIYRDFSGERLTPADVLLVVEVADTSLAFDLGRKAELMAVHGVADYWVVDAHTLAVTIHREPRADGYGAIRRLGATDPLEPAHPDLAALSFRLADLG